VERSLDLPPGRLWALAAARRGERGEEDEGGPTIRQT